MTKHVHSTGIILTRTDFREADRILTVLTPNAGKVSLLARGVRKSTSKLAGGIELFSVSQLTYIESRGSMHTLTSSRLVTHYRQIVEDIDRTMAGYEMLKRINRLTEEAASEEYFKLINEAFKGLNTTTLPLNVVKAWYDAQLIKISGQQPNLREDATGKLLREEYTYDFSFEDMSFRVAQEGAYGPGHIRLLRLLFGVDDPTMFSRIRDADQFMASCERLLSSITAYGV